VRFSRRGEKTVLADLFQSGSAKARFPKVFDGGPPEAVLINLAGGVTGADCFQQRIHFDEGTHAVVTTQAAEKIYKASEGAEPASVLNEVTVEADAFAEWLPQETIFFEGGRLKRRFEARLDRVARLLACEAVVFGRTAMGETVREGFLDDEWRVTVGDRIVYADGMRFDGAIQGRLDRPAIADGGRALATVLYVGPDSEGLIDQAKSALAPFQVKGKRAAASRIGDLIIARFIASDGRGLRAMLEAYLSTMRPVIAAGKSTLQPAAGAPKLWRC
jgi:urease accessory protein